jgi:hypothetical protein
MTPEQKAAKEQAKLVEKLKKLLADFTLDEIQAALVLAELIPAPTPMPTPPAPVVPTPAPETPVTPDVAPVTPDVPAVTPVLPADPIVSAPVEGKPSYYVWNENGDCVAIFNEDVHKGEAFMHAKELADQHPGWNIT